MVRAPCCEKMGLKRGPWSQEEDQILVDYINKHGHPNWRALPKLAGLLRCGKSCRLRWTNYLSPNIKRGNFSKEEEETIIQLHALMGNRWSAIAARLPGRTDNEIKNVWHTHLKKRVKPSATNDANMSNSTSEFQSMAEESEPEGTAGLSSALETSYNRIDSPQPSCTDVSSVAASTNGSFCMEDHNNIVVPENFPEMDDEFWSEVFSGELPAADENIGQDLSGGVYESTLHDDMDFWFNVFTRGEELSLI